MITTLKEYITGDFDPLDLEELNYYEVWVFDNPGQDGYSTALGWIRGRANALQAAIVECQLRWPNEELETDNWQVFPKERKYGRYGAYNLAVIAREKKYNELA